MVAPALLSSTLPKYANYTSSNYLLRTRRSQPITTTSGSSSSSNVKNYSYILPRYTPPRTTLRSTNYGENYGNYDEQEETG